MAKVFLKNFISFSLSLSFSFSFFFCYVTHLEDNAWLGMNLLLTRLVIFFHPESFQIVVCYELVRSGWYKQSMLTVHFNEQLEVRLLFFNFAVRNEHES